MLNYILLKFEKGVIRNWNEADAVLRNRQRTHQQARRELQHGGGNPCSSWRSGRCWRFLVISGAARPTRCCAQRCRRPANWRWVWRVSTGAWRWWILRPARERLNALLVLGAKIFHGEPPFDTLPFPVPFAVVLGLLIRSTNREAVLWISEVRSCTVSVLVLSKIDCALGTMLYVVLAVSI